MEETLQIVGPIRFVGDFYIGGSEQFGHDGIHGKSVTGGNDLRVFVQEGMADEFDDFAAAAADSRFLKADAVTVGDGGAESECGAIGVDMDLPGNFSNGFDSLRRRPQRVLIGSQFDDIFGF
jgi:hypothetical protein